MDEVRDFFADIDWSRWAEDAWTTTARVLVIVIAVYVALRLLRRFLDPALRAVIADQMEGQPQAEVDRRVETLSNVAYRTVSVIVIALALLTVAPEFGINTGALIAGAALAGLAIGFGAQKLVQDIIGGVFVLVENQFGKGDIVDLNGTVGEVIDINLRRTMVRDLNGTMHWIPHSVPAVTSNLARTFSRMHLQLGVSYSEDLDHVYEVINRTGREFAEDPEWRERILSPPAVMGLDGFDDSAITIGVLGETVPMQQWGATREFRKRLKHAFDAEGIEIPYPHRTLVSAGAKASKDGLLIRQSNSGGRRPEPATA